MPDGPAREARLELLRELASRGVTLDEMRRAIEEDRLVFLLMDRELSGEPKYTAREVAEQVGLPVEYLLAVRQAAGLALPDPDEKAYSEEDLELTRIIAELRSSGIPDEGLLEITRVLGRGLAQGAEVIRSVAGEAFLESGITEYELARRNAEAASRFLPMLAPLLQNILRLHLRDLIRNQAISQEELASGTARNASHVFVGFADIVGFTRLGERVELGELGALGARLTELALQHTQAADAPREDDRRRGDVRRAGRGAAARHACSTWSSGSSRRARTSRSCAQAWRRAWRSAARATGTGRR